MIALPSQTFASQLRLHRGRCEVSQADLARRMSRILGHSIEATAVTRIEQGRRAVRIDEAAAAAAALGVPLTALITEAPHQQIQAEIEHLLGRLSEAERERERVEEKIRELSRTIGELFAERRRLLNSVPTADSFIAESDSESGRTSDPDHRAPPRR